jgi:hypothetical protein
MYHVSVTPNLILPARGSVSNCGAACAPFAFDYPVTKETRVLDLRKRIRLEAWTVRQHYIFSWHHYQVWLDEVIMIGDNERVLTDGDLVAELSLGTIIHCSYSIVSLSIGIRRPLLDSSSTLMSIDTASPLYVASSTLPVASRLYVASTLPVAPVESLFVLYVAPAMGLDEVMRCAVALMQRHTKQ